MLFQRSTANLTDEEKAAAIDKLYQRARSQFPEVTEITAKEVLARRESGEKLLLVDVRTPEEQAVSMIRDAVTAEQFESDVSVAAGATVVCYCTIGGRSGMYARHLAARGIAAVNMPGAVLSWSHAGGEFVDADGPTNRVNTHGPSYDLVAEGYKAVW